MGNHLGANHRAKHYPLPEEPAFHICYRWGQLLPDESPHHGVHIRSNRWLGLDGGSDKERLWQLSYFVGDNGGR